MSKTNEIFKALGYKHSQETETGERPLCKNATRAALQPAIDEDKGGGKNGNK